VIKHATLLGLVLAVGNRVDDAISWWSKAVQHRIDSEKGQSAAGGNQGSRADVRAAR